MPYKICVDCEEEFWYDPGDEWKKHCPKCWYIRKHAEETTTEDYKRLVRENSMLRNQIAQQREQLSQYQDDYDPDYVNLLKNRLLDLTQFKINVMDRWKKLISLCHPDKHNNSDTANAITLWLLDIKK